MKVTVTQEDIDRGERGNPNACPISLALKRKKKGMFSVGYTRVHIKGKPGITWRLPDEAQKFVTDFDDKRRVKPFEFIAEHQVWRRLEY